MKKVSIIIPVYNTSAYLADTFDSALLQTYKNIEIIAVDDGSVDDSLRICREYSEKDSRIRVFSIENGGVARARNFGLDRAEGEFVMFLDSDDVYTADAVEKMVSAAEASGADIVSAGLAKVQGGVEKRLVCTDFSGDVYGDELYGLLENAFLGKNDALCSFIDKMYRLEFLKGQNIRFPALRSGEDTVFALEAMICASSIYFLEDHCFYKYVINDNSFTRKKMSLEKRLEFSNLFFAECEKLSEKYGMSFLKGALESRKALAVYDFVMNTVSRDDLSKKEKLSCLWRICREDYYVSIHSDALKKHSFRVSLAARLAAKERVRALFAFASLIDFTKKLKQKIKG